MLFHSRFLSKRSVRPSRWLWSIAVVILMASTLGRVRAQQKSYPTPYLSGLAPTGVTAGGSVEVVLAGDDLDEVQQLYFSHPGIRAERLPDPKPDPKEKKDKKTTVSYPIRFKITAAKDVSLGMHDVRAMGKWGVSNPRAFSVSDLTEVAEMEKNDDVPDAQAVAAGCVINGFIKDKTDVDYFRFDGKAGQRFVVHCAASSIDSRLMPLLKVYTESGQLLGSGHHYLDQDALVECVLAEDGPHYVRLCQFAYQAGGPEYFYRLAISERPWIDAVFPPVVEAGKAGKAAQITLFGRNLPDGKRSATASIQGRSVDIARLQIEVPAHADVLDFPGRLLPRSGSIDGFGVRVRNPHGMSNAALVTFARDPVVLDNQDNDTPKKAQPVTLPCVLCGMMEKPRDRDYYVFDAKKGDVYVLEAIGDRLRAPVDLVLQLRRLDNGQLVGVYDEHPEIPANVERFFTHTNDPTTRFVAPADGAYELLVRSQTSDLVAEPRHVYQVGLRKETPDFRLIVVGNHEFGGGFTLRRGSGYDLAVVCFRQDGFKGEIELSVEGLPPGVDCSPQRIGPIQGQAALVLNASSSAPDWVGPIVVKGTATIEGKKVTHAARAGCLVYPTAQANSPALSRLCRSVVMAVREKGPFAVVASKEPIAVPVGGQAKIKVKIARQQSDYKDNASISVVSGPAQPNGKLITIAKVNVAADKEGEVKVTVPANTEPGAYSLIFRGTGKIDVFDAAKKKRNVQFSASSTAIPFTVFNEVAELIVPPKLSLQAGTEQTLPIKIKRLHGYKGELQIEFDPPSGVSGLSEAKGKIAAGADTATLTIKASKDAKAISNPNFVVRALAKIDNVTLKHESKLDVTISNAKESNPAKKDETRKDVKTIKLIEEGAGGWKYAPAAMVKGNGWHLLEFDDKSWRAVKAPIGNGEDAIQSRGGTDLPDKGVPLMFRRVVEMPADLLSTKGVVVRLQVASDNGASVYINGKLVDADPADHEFQYWNREVAVPLAMMRAGRNLIAVELHNSPGSTDAYLDLSLTALAPK